MVRFMIEPKVAIAARPASVWYILSVAYTDMK